MIALPAIVHDARGSIQIVSLRAINPVSDCPVANARYNPRGAQNAVHRRARRGLTMSGGCEEAGKKSPQQPPPKKRGFKKGQRYCVTGLR